MSKVTVQEYAKHRGIGACQVRRYVKSGVLDGAVTRDGWRIYIDKAKANRLLAKSITPRKVLLDKGPVPSPSGKKTETAAEQRAVTRQAGTENLSYHESRTIKMRYAAALLKLELDVKTGRLVEAEAVKAAAFSLARAVRDQLLNLPDRISPILAAETDAGKVGQLLTVEIRQALEALDQNTAPAEQEEGK